MKMKWSGRALRASCMTSGYMQPHRIENLSRITLNPKDMYRDAIP